MVGVRGEAGFAVRAIEVCHLVAAMRSINPTVHETLPEASMIIQDQWEALRFLQLVVRMCR